MISLQSALLRFSGTRRSYCALVAALLMASGCDFPGQPNPANRPVPENQVVEFAPLFSRNCAGCHGADGRLGPAPPLNDPLFLAIVPDDVLLQTIRAGRRGTPMPAFAHDLGGDLTDAQIVALVKGIKDQWQAALPEDARPPEYLPGSAGGDAVVQGDRQKGATIFASACAECHGMRDADGKLAAGMVGAIDEPAFLALISNQALRRIIITGRPDLGMPNFSEGEGRAADFQPLTSADVDDLVALLAAWRAGSKLAGVQH